MQASILQRMQELPPPAVSSRGNSMAVGARGEIALLSSDGALHYIPPHLNGDYDDQANPGLPVSFKVRLDDSAQSFSMYHSMQFISDFGDARLLLWGDRNIGTLLIKGTSTLRETNDAFLKGEHRYLLADFLAKNVKSSQLIVKCDCHPYLENHALALLSQGPLLLINTSPSLSTETQYQVYPLDIRKSYTGFACGSGFGWQRWTVYLLSNEGSIYALNPVLPDSCTLDESMIHEMEAWVDECRTQGAGCSESYIDFCLSYIQRLHLPRNDNSRSRKLQSTVESIPKVMPVLQGPIKLLHSEKMMKDMSVIDADFPILVTSTEDGEVSIFALTSKLGPSWQHILETPEMKPSHSLEYQSCPEGALVETINILDSIAPQQTASDVSRCLRAEKLWKLAPDPLRKHCIHVTGFSCAASFLISLEWLDALVHASSPEESFKSTAFLDEHPSTCVPSFLYDAPSGSSNNGKGCISGMCVAHDPFIGHIAFFRTYPVGLVAAVNLTVHLRLCRLQLQLSRVRGNEMTSLGASPQQLTLLDSVDETVEAMTRGILQGISSTPTPSSSLISGQYNEEEGTRILTQAMGHLEKTVLAPMQELASRINFRTELTEEMLRAQAVVLEGKDGKLGLVAAIRKAQEQQKAGRVRLREIQEVFSRQREMAACILSQALALKSKVRFTSNCIF